MSKRLNACLTCQPREIKSFGPDKRGLTRHDDRVCAPCRKEGRQVSTCDPNDPNACASCTPVDCGPDLFMPEPTQLSPEQVAQLEEMLGELKGLRQGARELKRSGNPAVKAEGVKALAHIEDQIQWVTAQLSKEDE